MKFTKFYLLVILCMVINICAFSQSPLSDLIVRFNADQSEISIAEVFRIAEQQHKIIFSYNASSLWTESMLTIEKQEYSIKELMSLIAGITDIRFIYREPDKIIISYEKKPAIDPMIAVRGFVYDKEHNQALIGALLTEQHSGITVATNESGYYFMRVPAGNISVEIRYLGYRDLPFQMVATSGLFRNFYLEGNNRLPEIVISERVSDRINHWNSGENMDVYKSREFKSLMGEADLINNARILPGIQSGGEGQNGLLVRGGSYDQNLVLLEGVPLYETSHTAGIASNFIDETVKSASLIKNGFPARYAGRLSSVLDVHLAEGNLMKHETKASVGIPGAKLHFNGPMLNKKGSYNIGMRTSWIDYYVNNFLKPFTRYDQINIGYSDLTGKFTYTPSQRHKFSLSFYTGNDRLFLSKSESFVIPEYKFESNERNTLRWGNRLLSAQWYFNPSDKIHITTRVGVLNYSHRARSSYIFDTDTGQQFNRDELDILSYADITDINTGVHADYFASDRHTLKAGIVFSKHRFNPVVKQSLIILEGASANILDKDSVIIADEYGMYIEDQFKLTRELKLYGGFHFSGFKVNGRTYHSLQPRINLLWTPGKAHLVSFSLSKMTQNIHLLVNSGLGLPSDLWVPSTENIAPQNAWQYSLSYSANIRKGIHFYTGLFLKNFNNLIEYTTSPDLFYFFINDQNIVPVFNNSRDWERNIFSGSGMARGIEMMIQRKNTDLNGWLSVTWSKSERTFAGINEGKAFPFVNDRTWDVNAGISRSFSEKFSAGISGVYGTGSTFSLATEEFDSFLGIRLLNPDGRNNYRLPPFMQLSINANYSFMISKLESQIDFNIYNVLNRLNAFYIYIYKNPVTGDNILRKVSILPITPSVNFSVKF
jgi:hypothetical protein